MSDSTITSWVIEFSFNNGVEPLKLRLDDRLVVGRYDVTQSRQPDVDLEPYNAEELGVSRQHLMLHTENEQLLVTDLNSGNGTFLNGHALDPQKGYLVKHGDHLQLGNLHLDVKIIIAPSFGSSFNKQPNLLMNEEIHKGNGQLVLIVEDDNEVAQLLSLLMQRFGYTTAISRDVLGAIRIFNQKSPSAVILDLMLPHVHGLEFCRYVRRDAQRGSTPIIIVSAARTDENVSQAMQAGADVFLGKPVSAKELGHVVTSLISQHESGRATLYTKHLAGTAPLQAMAPETRRNTVAMFVAGHSDAPITITVNQPVSFGRTANLPGKTHVDLSRYGAVDLGVSRIHMILHFKNGKFYVEDAGSVNGTFIGGEPIPPNELRPVRNADEVRLGQLRMYIYFLTDSEEDDL